MALGPRSLSLRACGGALIALLAASVTATFASAESNPSGGALTAAHSATHTLGNTASPVHAPSTRAIQALPGMYATDNAGNFFRIDLHTAAPTIITAGFACSASGLSVTELEYNNDTQQGIVQDSDGNFSFNTLNFTTGLPSGPTTPDGAALNGMEWVHGFLYAVSIPGPGGAPSTLITLDPTTGVTTPVGPTGLSNISGLAWHKPTQTLYGVTAGGAPSNLVKININTGAAAIIANTGVILGSLEFGPDGRLYGGGGQANANELYDIDRMTGVATLIGNTGLGASAITGLALVEDRRDFYAVNNLSTSFGAPADELIRFQFDDPANLTVIGPIFDTGGTPLTGLGGLDFNQDGSVLYASDAFGATPGAIYRVNPATAQATLLGVAPTGGLAIADLAWNPMRQELFGIDSANNLWTKLGTPAAAVNLGPFSVGGLVNVGLAFDALGNLYVHDVVNDIIYTAPPATPTALAPLHALPYDSNFSQGLFADWSRNSRGYHGAFNNSAFLSEDYLFGTLVSGGGYGPFVGAFPFDVGLGIPTVEVGDLTRMPVPPCAFVNRSFETGDFTGWTTLDLSSPLTALGVGIGGAFWPPTDGTAVAYHGFDGNGATSGHPIKIAQDVWVNGANLSFDWRASWDMTIFGATLARTFDVVVRSAASGLELARFTILVAPPGTSNPDTGPQTSLVNLSAFRNQRVNVCFEWTIPEDFTGPAQFQLDNICLFDCVGDLNNDGATNVFDFAIFAANFGQAVPPNTNGDLDGNGTVNVFDFAIFAADFGCPS